MKKLLKVLSIGLLSSVVMIAGCDGESSSVSDSSSISGELPDEPTNDEIDGFKTLELREKKLTLVYDKTAKTYEEKQLNPICYPRLASPELTYESSNVKIATVSATGVVKAVKSGTCVITVKSKTGSKVATLPVAVYENKNITKSKAKTIGKTINTNQQNLHLDQTDKILLRENYTETLYKNGVLQTQYDARQRITVSYKNAYARVQSDDAEIKCEGGNKNYSSYDWVFYTTESFDTYVFHTSHDVKGYMIVPSQSFIDSGTRNDGVYSVLDNLFNSGKGLMTNQLANVLGEKQLVGSGLGSAAYVSSATSYASFDETHDLYFRFAESYGNQTAVYDDEQDNNIPVGTSYTIDIDLAYRFTNNVLSEEYVTQSYTYIIGGDTYKLELLVSSAYYTEDEVELEYPDYREYTLGTSIYDI